MSQETHARRILPEVLLIAVLLLITGSAGTIRQVYAIWQWYQYAHGPVVQFLTGLDRWMSPLQAVVFLLLNIAAVVAAVGLLRHARWARRASLGVLAGLVVVPICFGLLNTVQLLLPYLRYGLIGQGFARVSWLGVLSMLLYPLNYLVMFAFLAARRVADAWDEPPMPLAQRLVGPLSVAMPPVVALVALLMVSHALPSLVNLYPMLKSLQQSNMLIDNHYFRNTQLLGMLTPLAIFAAGGLLLLRAKGAITIASIVLFLSSVILGMMVFAFQNYYRGADRTITVVQLAPTLLAMAPGILTYLTQAGFLVRFRGTSGTGNSTYQHNRTR